ncbi:hypothetical protein [Legionella maioricensis]|uniref:Uncharacterized protein n=1 Tax=Legionella maioricensis TaxID=2896528 RepID=A0A9X2CY51_9GAMM|nr:hypothetical protein [Legionella maioricensis]MCL9683034.1 hypothetical protein [Legionella maioricensis]MCL9686382.1 hypothetical protein [Legionella maioricensis]
MKGRLYYRSDTRPPEQIFKDGFSPRIDGYGDGWWKEAIKYRGYTNDCGINYQSIDGDASVCICMTTKLESAPIFPLNTETSYIYAIALPEPTKIEYLGKGKGEVRLSRTSDTPSDFENIILDFHSFQATQTGNICRFFDHGVDNLGAYAGWSLYAYEALAYKVPPQSIICAIKCVREKADQPLEVSCEIATKPKRSEDKKFVLDGPVIANSNFSSAHTLSIGQGCESRWDYMDYNPLKEQARKEIQAVIEQGETSTPNIYYGLGGKTF